MPATVVRIEVSPGQTVAKDSLLVMLEAMKMELPIRAPRDGRVTAIHCRAGEIVQPGVPLLEIIVEADLQTRLKKHGQGHRRAARCTD